ncbi:MAG: SDR family NAD(P)-dependent oxidoreductase [Pseudomonadota bacterium]
MEHADPDPERPHPSGKGKTALIIGAGDHLGSAIARRFACEGYHIVATRRRGDLDTLVDGIRQDGGTAIGLHSDARDEAAVTALFEQIETDMPPLDAVVFNIGGNVRFGIRDTTSRVYRKVWEMCAFAGFLVGREAARLLGARGSGSILFTGATASVRGGNGFAAFAGGKFALRALAQSMARELGPEGVHVAHVVIDGAIDTAWTRERFPEKFAEGTDDTVLQPDDLAELYWTLHSQPRGAWTFELDVRPHGEPW